MKTTTVFVLGLVSGVLAAPLGADSRVLREEVVRLNQTHPGQRPVSRVASMRQGGMDDNLIPLGVKPMMSHVQHDNQRGSRNGWRGYKHDNKHGDIPPEYYGGMDKAGSGHPPVSTPVSKPVPTPETTSPTPKPNGTTPNTSLRATTQYQSPQSQAGSARFPFLWRKPNLLPLLLPSNLTTAPPAAATPTITAATSPAKFSFLDLFKPKSKAGEDLAAVSKQPKKPKNFLADFFKRMKEYFTKVLERGKEIFAKYLGPKGEKGIKQGTTSKVGDYAAEPAAADEKGDPSPLGR
ncbi:hypothetical protein GQ602_002126 [Ophiocordyceps camponoti-floridani]|uniref:Uncharacterized protein n=1 Tax=Ophiocordyceps camponoti-floridani TaxID=2030778 RepID=A0A8H4Q9V8_9HYPO|nr:hypothetical protein GQ602_002126 [Ophiocordyceps camponoti-floridani]